MTTEEEHELSITWHAMWQAYDRKLTVPAMRLILKALQPYTLEEVLEAIPVAMRELTWLPTVGQVIKRIKKTPRG